MINLFPIPWNVPIINYWLFYLLFGVIGFLLCFVRSYFLYAFVPLLIWFCISDMRSFYYPDAAANKLGPSEEYILGVAISMVCAFCLGSWGAYLHWRRQEE